MRVARQLGLLITGICATSVLTAQEINGRFGTSLYTWERFDTVNSSKVISRVFQSVQLNIKQGNLSFQTSLMGAMNVGKEFGDEGTIRASSLLLRWNNIGNVLDAAIGRVPIYAGVGIGTVDGVLLKSALVDRRYTFQAFGGGNVRSDLVTSGLSNLQKNFFLGAQAVGDVSDNLRFGISYANRNMERSDYVTVRPDSLGNPVSLTVSPESRAEQLLGADARYEYRSLVVVSGRYDYDLNLEKSRRGQLHARVFLTDMVNLTGEFIYREPLLYYNSYFTVFESSPSHEYEGGVEYTPMRDIYTYAKYAYVQFVDAVSRRVSVGASWKYASVSFSGTNGYAGDLTSVGIQGMYPVYERKFIPTLGFWYSSYTPGESTAPSEGVYSGSLGLVVRMIDQVSFDGQVQWIRNPVAEQDVRLFLKASYWFHSNLGLLTGDER